MCIMQETFAFEPGIGWRPFPKVIKCERINLFEVLIINLFSERILIGFDVLITQTPLTLNTVCRWNMRI